MFTIFKTTLHNKGFSKLFLSFHSNIKYKTDSNFKCKTNTICMGGKYRLEPRVKILAQGNRNSKQSSADHDVKTQEI
jgi:hypothetical protein